MITESIIQSASQCLIFVYSQREQGYLVSRVKMNDEIYPVEINSVMNLLLIGPLKNIYLRYDEEQDAIMFPPAEIIKVFYDPIDFELKFKQNLA